jgi:hypothetical protein
MPTSPKSVPISTELGTVWIRTLTYRGWSDPLEWGERNRLPDEYLLNSLLQNPQARL